MMNSPHSIAIGNRDQIGGESSWSLWKIAGRPLTFTANSPEPSTRKWSNVRHAFTDRMTGLTRPEFKTIANANLTQRLGNSCSEKGVTKRVAQIKFFC